MLSVLREIFIEYGRQALSPTLLVIFVTLIGALAGVAAPYAFAQGIDHLASGVVTLGQLTLYAVLFGVSVAFSQGSRYIVFLCAERLTFVTNTLFFKRLLNKQSEFFVRYNPVEIGHARNEGSQTINLLTQMVIAGILPGVALIVASLFIIGSLMTWEIAAIVLGYGLLVVGLDYFRVKVVTPSLNDAMERGQANAALIGNAISLIQPIRQTRSENWIDRRFASGALQAFEKWKRYAIVSCLFSGAAGLLLIAQLVLNFTILLPRFQAGAITLGDIVLFNTLLIQLNEPFRLVGMAIKETAEASGRFGPLVKMWRANSADLEKETASYIPSAGTVILQDVSHTHASGRGVGPVSFEARRGAITFLTGSTGSGKSTLVRLLVKDLAPHQGCITADGLSLCNIRSADWFGAIGVVPQEINLLNDTLAVNIALGRPVDEGKLREAAARASILTRIEAMPEGFETFVGERGMKLSGGERQRIAIARALYGNPAIIILDEASSSLDEGTEREIMDALRSELKELTVIAVTHRRSSIRPEDNVIVLPTVQTPAE